MTFVKGHPPYHVPTTHGLSRHPLYMTWYNMLDRCENPAHVGYRNYGGRGIKVSESWHDVATFVADIEREIGPRPPGLTLDRIDNDGDYESGNVQWADWSQQMTNKRRREPERWRVIADLMNAGMGRKRIARELGLSLNTVAYAMRRIKRERTH